MIGKFGRKPYDYNKPTVHLENYLTGSLPPAPKVIDRATKVKTWPMYLNDKIGDCTIAAAGHEIEAWTAYANVENLITNTSVLSVYEQISGYNPDDPSTDTGCEVTDVLKYWQKTGIGGHKIAAWAEIDAGNITLMKQVLNVFGSVYLGINFPASADDQFNAGKPWSYVAGSPIEGGHAIPIQRWDDGHVGSIEVVTWGVLQRMTLGFARHYVEEAYVVVSQDWITANGDSIEGLSLPELIADSRSL